MPNGSCDSIIYDRIWEYRISIHEYDNILDRISKDFSIYMQGSKYADNSIHDRNYQQFTFK